MKFSFVKVLVLLSVLFLLSDCSSSSISQRYGQKKDKTENTNDIVKFTNENDIMPDTLTDIDISLDSLDEYNEHMAIQNKNNQEAYLTKLTNRTDTSVAGKDLLMMKIIELRDSPYKYGGNSKDGLDCSAFTRLVFQSTFDYNLPRSAREQYQVGLKINSRDSLQTGDLVFFNTSRRRFPGHVGIYLGENLFVHASRSLGVTISSLDEKYYTKRYVGSRRINEINNKL
jgi:cell wall-associated NlpC family hydrolase